MDVLDRLQRGIADFLAAIPQNILGVGAQELEIVFENVLNSQKYILESSLSHQWSQGLSMIGNGRGHALNKVFDVVQFGLNDRLAEFFKAVNVERNVVVHQKDRLRSMRLGVSDVGQDPIEYVSVEIPPAHLDDGAEAAIEGAPARRLDDVDLATKQCVSTKDAGVPVR